MSLKDAYSHIDQALRAINWFVLSPTIKVSIELLNNAKTAETRALSIGYLKVAKQQFLGDQDETTVVRNYINQAISELEWIEDQVYLQKNNITDEVKKD